EHDISMCSTVRILTEIRYASVLFEPSNEAKNMQRKTNTIYALWYKYTPMTFLIPSRPPTAATRSLPAPQSTLATRLQTPPPESTSPKPSTQMPPPSEFHPLATPNT